MRAAHILITRDAAAHLVHVLHKQIVSGESKFEDITEGSNCTAKRGGRPQTVLRSVASHGQLVGIANAIDLADRFLPKLESLNCKPFVVTFRIMQGLIKLYSMV
ncbi:hypothetical protein EJB05_13216, partial [Eragrostis curvula]